MGKRLIDTFLIHIAFLIAMLLAGCAQQSANTSMKMPTGKIVFANSGELIQLDVSSKQKNTIYARGKDIYKYALYPNWHNDMYISAVRESIVEKDYIVLISGNGKVSRELIRFAEKECTMPAVSPDKAKIAFLCGEYVKEVDKINYKLYVASINGKQIKSYPFPCSYNQPSWSSNGLKIAVTGADKVIYSIDTVTGNQTEIIRGVAASFSPDGHYLAYFQPRSNSRRSDLKLLSLSTGEIKILISDSSFGSPIENSPQWSLDSEFLFFVKFSAVLFPPERQVIEAYSLAAKTLIKIIEVDNKIHGFSFTQL